MRTGIRNVLQQVLAAQYYRINAGFFLLLFLLLFGIISPKESLAFHYQVMTDLSPGYGYTGIVVAMLGAT